METFADTSALDAGVKEKNTKTNKITIVKNQKLATQAIIRSRLWYNDQICKFCFLFLWYIRCT
jgi:hypothetical protein